LQLADGADISAEDAAKQLAIGTAAGAGLAVMMGAWPGGGAMMGATGTLLGAYAAGQAFNEGMALTGAFRATMALFGPAAGRRIVQRMVAPLTRGQRLTEYFNRLRGQPASRTAEEALGRVNQTLTVVEDALSGIPRQNPPPPRNMPDGRMYPPLEDSIIRNPNGSITANTRGHTIEIGRDGSITMTNRQTGQVDFHQPGAGGGN
jgi:hypothetical protein